MPTLALSPAPLQVPFFAPDGTPFGTVAARTDGTLGAPIVTGSNPDMEASISGPTNGPPPSFNLTVLRESVTLWRGNTCGTWVSLYDAASRRRLLRVSANDTPAGLDRFGGWGTYDCRGEVRVVYPAGVSATRSVYVLVDRGVGQVIGRSAPFRLSDLVRQGTDSRYVNDDRGIGERIVDATAGAASWTDDKLNKLLWAGGLAGGVVLLMLARK